MKRSLSLILTFTFLLALCVPFGSIAAANGINVFIDGVPVYFDDASGYPFVSGGRTLVPLRATMESFGAEVSWDSTTSTAFVKKDSTTVRCKIDENCIYRNNVRIENDAKAVIVASRTYLPIRAVLESFGATVTWDGAVRVTSMGSESLVYAIETSPAVTKNYWGIWNDALTLKASGDFRGAISKIMSISSAFLAENTSASNAMLFKHIGECYSNLGEYANASACFKKEAYYWGITPGMEESRIDAKRRSNLIKTNTQVYVKTNDITMGGRTYFGEVHEPQGGIYLGAYAEGDTAIYDPYNPSRFYMDTFPQLVGRDIGGYLLYLPYGQSVTMYNSHIEKAIQKNKILQISLEPHGGVGCVNENDSYLIQLAKDMESSGCKMMLRFAGEMNDTTSSWYTTDTNFYISKFRIVANIFHTYAPSVPVIWAPNFYPPDTIDDYYPGDEYVDYVGISSYMMHQPETDPLGQGVDRSRWSNQLDNIYSLYGHKKPIMIVEGGASYMDYMTWADITPFASSQLKDFYTYLPIKYPNVKLCFIFDFNRERQKFSLSANSQYLAAYKEGITSDLFLGDTTQSQYKYDYYELGQNVKVKAEPTELCSYITTPANDTAYVNYYINGVYLSTAYAAPYNVNVDFTSFKGQKVNITVQSFNQNNLLVTDYTISVNVI